MFNLNLKIILIFSELTIYRTPQKYANLTPPKRVPPPKVDIPIELLPLPGFLEQSVSGVLVDAFKELVNFKPKFPTKTTKESVLKYLSIYLKAHNPKNNNFTTEKYKEKLAKYQEYCELTGFLLYFARNHSDALLVYGDSLSEDLAAKKKAFDEIDDVNLLQFIR